MFAGINTLPSSSIKSYMHALPYTFHPTGSRYFGGVHAKSDWDFFTQYNFKLSQTLAGDSRFQKLMFTTYTDMLCIEVWRTKLPDGNTLDIQLVRNYDLKVQVHKQLMCSPAMLRYFIGLQKEERPWFWDFMFRSAANIPLDSTRDGFCEPKYPDVSSIIEELP